MNSGDQVRITRSQDVRPMGPGSRVATGVIVEHATAEKIGRVAVRTHGGRVVLVLPDEVEPA